MSTPALQRISEISHHVDALEEIAEREFFTIAQGSPQALDNLLARLGRVQQTIQMAASK